MEKLRSLFDMGMTLESTERQLKNGTYILHSADVKSQYLIYTNPDTGFVKRVSHKYDLQHHSQLGKIIGESNLKDAIEAIKVHHAKYLKRHTENTYGIADGALCVMFCLTHYDIDKNIILAPWNLFNTLFSKCTLLHKGKKISTQECYDIYQKNVCLLKDYAAQTLTTRDNDLFFLVDAFGKNDDETQQLQVLLNTVFKMYICNNTTAEIYQTEHTRDGIRSVCSASSKSIFRQ